MTVNQREFLKLQEKISRWISAGEKKGIFFEFDVPDMPSRITKEYLQELNEMIPKKRWQFFEKYGVNIETETPYVRPQAEIEKAKETARKGAETRRRNKGEEIADNSDYSDTGEWYEDWYEKAYAYAQNLIAELMQMPVGSTGVDNRDVGEEDAEILDDFINHYADPEECEIFCKNYENNKGVLVQLFQAIVESYYEEEIRENNTAYLNLVFEGTDFKYDDYKLEWLYAQRPSAYGGYRNAKYYG